MSRPARRTRDEGTRRTLIRIQRNICPLCGEPIIVQRHTRNMGPTLDHVIPKSIGGPDRIGNLLCAHRLCNGRKGDRMPFGCELVWLLAVNARLGVQPQEW